MFQDHSMNFRKFYLQVKLNHLENVLFSYIALLSLFSDEILKS